MAEYTKVHGMRMADNSHIKNFRVEPLASDPQTVLVAGEAWFNTTEKKYKCTTLAPDGVTVIIRSFATVEELLSFMSSLASTTAGSSGAALIGYDGTTVGDISIPAGTVKQTLDRLATALDGEIQAREAAVGGVNTAFTVNDEGNQISSSVRVLNFVGANVQAMSDDGSTVNVYVPPPSFTSHFNTNDGTAGTNVISDVSIVSRYIATPASEGTPYKVGDWTPGVLHSVVTASTLNYVSPNKVCFDNLTSSFTVNVYDANGTTVLASCSMTNINGNSSQTNQGITITLTGWATQYNKYMANLTVTIALNTILPNGGRFSVSMVHQSLATYTKTQNNLFYDNSTTDPAITSVVINPNALLTNKWLSGVRYFDKTDPFTITLNGINNLNHLTYPQPFITVESNATYGITDFTLNGSDLTAWTTAYNNANASYSGVKAISRSNFRVIGNAAIDAYPTDKSSPKTFSASLAMLIDTYASASTDLNEDFVDEGKRRTNAWAAWNSQNPLSANDLMVIGGTLRRQYGNWTTYYPTNTASYSSTQTQYYYRGYRVNGVSKSNGIINISGCTQTDLDNGNIKVWISLDGTNWFLCNSLYAGGVLTNGAGCRINKDTRPLPQLEFTLGTGGSTTSTTGPDGWGIYVKIEMPNGSNVQITNLDITNW